MFACRIVILAEVNALPLTEEQNRALKLLILIEVFYTQ